MVLRTAALYMAALHMAALYMAALHTVALYMAALHMVALNSSARGVQGLREGLPISVGAPFQGLQFTVYGLVLKQPSIGSV